MQKLKVKKCKNREEARSFLKTKKEDKEHKEIDDYLILLQHIYRNKEYERSFDPIRVRMYILQPETPERSMFTLGVKAYKRRDFVTAF